MRLNGRIRDGIYRAGILSLPIARPMYLYSCLQGGTSPIIFPAYSKRCVTSFPKTEPRNKRSGWTRQPCLSHMLHPLPIDPPIEEVKPRLRLVVRYHVAGPIKPHEGQIARALHFTDCLAIAPTKL